MEPAARSATGFDRLAGDTLQTASRAQTAVERERLKGPPVTGSALDIPVHHRAQDGEEALFEGMERAGVTLNSIGDAVLSTARLATCVRGSDTVSRQGGVNSCSCRQRSNVPAIRPPWRRR
jgi:hypothetical protein